MGRDGAFEVSRVWYEAFEAEGAGECREGGGNGRPPFGPPIGDCGTGEPSRLSDAVLPLSLCGSGPRGPGC